MEATPERVEELLSLLCKNGGGTKVGQIETLPTQIILGEGV